MKKWKKIIPIVIIVILAAVLSVEVFLFVKNNPKKNPISVLVNDVGNNEVSDEKTIDLHGTYSENDLLIKNEKIKVDGYSEEIEIVQIEGLKDKKIEAQINQNIKNALKKFVEDNKQDAMKKSEIRFSVFEEANFSNVLSIMMVYDGYNIGTIGAIDYSTNYMGLNYNLTNGETIKFEDLFKKNEELTPIVRQILFKAAALYNHRKIDATEGDPGFTDEPFYDAEKKGWYAKYSWFDEKSGEQKTEIREYVLPIDENEIEKYTKKYLNSDNQDFYFSPAELSIIIKGESFTIPLPEIADKVVIYDKYLTDTSIFEKDGIGADSVVTCSYENYFGKLKEAKYERNNFFYDISLYANYSKEYPTNSYTDQKEKEAINKLREKVNEYKTQAANNPNKAYFVVLEAELSNVSYEESEYDSVLGHFVGTTDITNLLISNIKEKVIICDISKKDEALKYLLSRYRYYNINFYGTIYNFMVDESLNTTEVEVKASETSNYYDIIAKKEIKEVKEIFKDSEHYLDVLKMYTRNVAYDSKTLIKISSSGINVTDKSNNNNYIPFNTLRPYLALKILNSDGTVKEEPEDNTNTYTSNEVTNTYTNTYTNSYVNTTNTYIENTTDIVNSTIVNEPDLNTTVENTLNDNGI